MKKSTRISMLAAIVGMILSIGAISTFSSFKKGNQPAPKDQKAVLVQAWFECIDPANPDNPESYRYLAGQSPTCSGSDDVCAIYADVQNNALPDASKRPVQTAASGSGYSLEDLSNESDEFSMNTDNVKLEE
ncbi:MAG: hypothetical protein GXC78_05510 [Chitinophagaceae bacterium]|nr:hypothetical protein [Chitinophagaceae bacterium]